MFEPNANADTVLPAEEWRAFFFGGFRLERGGIVTRFPTRKTAALCAWLVLNPGKSFSRDLLADRFWPDFDPDAARNSLRVALNALRKIVEANDSPVALKADRAAVALTGRDIPSDVAAFEQAVQEDRNAPSTEQSIAALERAVALYDGPFLAEWYEDWVEPERTRFTDLHIAALLRLADLLARRGQPEIALEYAERAVAADTEREDSHRRVMRLLLELGRPDAARRQYQRLERILQDTLGTAPSSLTRDLLESPLSGTLPPGEVRRGEPRGEGIRFPALPLPMNRFHGRVAERNALVTALATPGDTEPRLLTLTGPGGVGKSRLALEVAADTRDRLFAGCVAFVALNGSSLPAQIAATIAAALQIPLTPEEDPLNSLVRSLTGPSALLVLDEFEVVTPEGIAWFQTFRQRLPNVVFIVTSRHRLHLTGETEFSLTPLQTPTDADIELETLAENPAVALFVDRAEAVRREFRLDKDNRAIIAELCARLDGLPLAIELAAAWTRLLTPAQILERLAARFHLLVSEAPGVPERHRSLFAVMEESAGMLPDTARELFARLSVFQGGWELDAVAPVCDVADALPCLAVLQERSLIQTEEAPSGRRFRMLDTIREYATGLLTPEEKDEARRRHAVYFAEVARAARTGTNGTNANTWLPRLDAERANLRAACDAARDLGDLELASTFIRGLWRYWYATGVGETGLTFIETVLRIAEARNGSVHASLYEAAGRLAFSLGHSVRARGWLEQGLDGFRQMPDMDRRAAEVATNLALAAQAVSDNAGACRAYRLVLDEKKRLGDAWGMAWCLMEIGKHEARRGASEVAADCYREAARLRSEVGDTVGADEAASQAAQWDSVNNITGEEPGIPHNPLLSDIPREWQFAHSYLGLGHMAAEQGDFGAALPLLCDALAAYRKINDPAVLALTLERLGFVYLRCGAISEARTALEEAVGLRGDWENDAGTFVRALLNEVSAAERSTAVLGMTDR
jgi:predicted ATPase/DNA-binding SARP family transcriptional activator